MKTQSSAGRWHRKLVRILTLAGVGGLLFLAPGAGFCQETDRLTEQEFLALFPDANLSDLTEEQREAALRNPILIRLKKTLRTGAEMLSRISKALPESAPASAPADEEPAFDGLEDAKEIVGDTLTQAQLERLLGSEFYSKMSEKKRARASADSKLVSFYKAIGSGRLSEERIRSVAQSVVTMMLPPLITNESTPLRGQFPKEGKYFKLDMSLTTGWFYIESERKAKQRDRQIANVWAALTDEDGESDINEMFYRIATLSADSKGNPGKVNILLNLKMLYRSAIGANDAFDVITLGLENPWVSTGQPIPNARSVLCHELGHMLQGKLYGWKSSVGIFARFEGFRHNPWVTTNASLSFSEGFGDYCGVSFGKGSHWDWSEAFRHEDGKAENALKSKKNLLRTEGVVTQILLTAEEEIPRFRNKMLASMGVHKPTSITAFVKGYSADYPRDAKTLAAVVAKLLAGAR